jgi:hypothetical protein
LCGELGGAFPLVFKIGIMERNEKIFQGDNCPMCGDDLIVNTECLEEDDSDFEQWYYDGDEVRCAANCGFKSFVSCDENGAWIQDVNADELVDNN